jgi:hypothetical protein
MNLAMPNTGPADELASIREQVRILQRREAELRRALLGEAHMHNVRRAEASARTPWNNQRSPAAGPPGFTKRTPVCIDHPAAVRNEGPCRLGRGAAV